eukprot:1140478-Pelagomonas_calceolata.AAC.1
MGYTGYKLMCATLNCHKFAKTPGVCGDLCLVKVWLEIRPNLGISTPIFDFRPHDGGKRCLDVKEGVKNIPGLLPELWKQRFGLRGQPTPSDIPAHSDPARPPIDHIPFAMVSAMSLLHT